MKKQQNREMASSERAIKFYPQTQTSKNFSALYELLFSQHNAPKVKFQNPDACRN
jgi:hypothetical protein